MKYTRFKSGNNINWGEIIGNEIVELSDNYINPDSSKTNTSHSLSDVKLISPVTPGKVVAIGLNYKSHLGDKPAPAVPEPFYKLPDTIIGPGENIVIPKEAIAEKVKMQPEAELCLVMGKGGKRISQSDALSHVFGYTCGNDVSARDWQQNDLQWWRAKSCDTFTVLGPWVETDFDPGEAQIQCRINDEVVQNQNISDLLHGVPRIIEFVSSLITLNPGDVIMTGTPGVPKDMFSGDTVEVEIEGIGILSNPVINE
tara:strand:- start:2969 stop:3736 length:768 start_codon:yes stop_codon:yes gene_type:complete